MPNGTLAYKRGEIWSIELQSGVDSQTAHKCLCLILQNDIGNQNGVTTMVAPLLPGFKQYPFAVNIVPTADNGLDRERHINFSQMRAVDARRIEHRLGMLENNYWEAIAKAACIELGFDAAFQ